MIPRPHQQAILDLNPHKYLLAHDVGTGKTLTALKLAEQNQVQCLIITPKKLKEQWLDQPQVVRMGHKVVTKEEFKNNLEAMPAPGGLIIDEAHYFANASSGLTKALRAYLAHIAPRYVWLLTATPYLSTPWNVYTLAQHVGHEFGYLSFRNKYCVPIRMGKKTIWKPKKNIKNDLAKDIARIGSAVSFEQVVDEVPDQVFEVVRLPLHENLKARRMDIPHYDKLTVMMKWHQMVNGILIGDEYNDDEIMPNDAKLDWLRNELEATRDYQIAVVARYNLQLEQYRKLAEQLERPVYVLQGATKNFYSTVKEIRRTRGAVVLIQAAISEGYELPTVEEVIFASMSYSYKDYKQMLGRFLRLSNPTPTRFRHLLIENTVDEAVYKNINQKKDINLAMYNEYF